MAISDWWVEYVTGKVDGNPIYGELNLQERRNPRKRAAYIAQRLAEAARSQSPAEADLAVLKRTIYASDYIMKGQHNADLEQKVIHDAFAVVFADSARSPNWDQAVVPLKEEPGIAFYFPVLFGGTMEDVWDDYKTAMTVKREKAESEARALAARKASAAKAKAEAEAAQQRARQQQRANIKSNISSLEAELARLNSMFHNTTDQMTRYKLVISIESTEDTIQRLKEML
jgi:hypothetical protein